MHRSVRPLPPSEVSLLTSFAAHAAVALENARLFAELDDANRAVTEHASAVEGAAVAHDRLTDLLLGAAASTRSPASWPRFSVATSPFTTRPVS